MGIEFADYITFDKPIKIKELIQEALNEKEEWGTIRIGKFPHDRKLEYKHGNIVFDNIGEDIKEATVKKCFKYSFWTCTDYSIDNYDKQVKTTL